MVELSIVLVILGLLVGGILGGQSLVHASQLRSITTDLDRYEASIATFRDTYHALPGDMTNATLYWGKDNTNCPGNTGTAQPNGTCNGDGNGQLVAGGGVGVTAEIFQFWKQLALAGLIEGTYSGLSYPGGSVLGRSALPGYNVPASRMQNVAYAIEYYGTVPTGSTVLWAGVYDHTFVVGMPEPSCCPPEGVILKPEDAWNIDTKNDDGNPAYGSVRTFYRNSYLGGVNCTTTDSESTTAYQLNNASGTCNLAVISGY